jgi:NtrC-family two-component system response regulator AlgB
VIEIELPSLRERREDIVPLARRLLARFAAEHRRDIQGFTPEGEAALQAHAWPGNLRELSNAMERAAILNQGQWVAWESPRPSAPAAKTQPPSPDQTLEDLEEGHIRRVLDANKPLEESARILGIDVATLWRKRKKYGLLGEAAGR